ncbi:MAG: acetylglutamate kinase [Phycisphaerales bacterium]|jgi:acetylglutamate kinase|nr:acetylglutamate kinase [Phycisphaerales bacterium]
MEQAIIKSRALIEAMDYIRKFKNRVVVIKFGGSIMDDPDAIRNILRDVVFMQSVGMHPVIIHGGGKAISHAMEERNLEVQFVQGRRYTDQRTLTVVEHVLCNEVNRHIVKTLESFGVDAVGLHTLDSGVLFGERLYLEDEGRKIDLGFVGKVNRVNGHLIQAVCGAGTIPVLASLAADPAGQRLNCNADTAAGEVAHAMKAEKFVVLSDTHGIRTDIDDPESNIPEITAEEIRKLIEDGTIAGGMLPKVEACLRALEGGVKRTHIIDGRFPHSLLLEIFTHKGIGTQINA